MDKDFALSPQIWMVAVLSTAQAFHLARDSSPSGNSPSQFQLQVKEWSTATREGLPQVQESFSAPAGTQARALNRRELRVSTAAEAMASPNRRLSESPFHEAH